MSWTDNMKDIARVVLAVLIALAASYTGYFALHEHPINQHLVYFAGAGLLLAGLIADADPLFDALKKLLSLLPSIKIGSQP